MPNVKEQFHKEKFVLGIRPPRGTRSNPRGMLTTLVGEERLEQLGRIVAETNIPKAELVRMALDKFFERVEILKNEAEWVKGR